MGTVRIYVDLAGLIEFGEARESVAYHTVGGKWINVLDAVSVNRNTISAKRSGPVLTVRRRVSRCMGLTIPVKLDDFGVAEGCVERSTSKIEQERQEVEPHRETTHGTGPRRGVMDLSANLFFFFFFGRPPPTGQWGARRSTGGYNTRHDMFAPIL